MAISIVKTLDSSTIIVEGPGGFTFLSQHEGRDGTTYSGPSAMGRGMRCEGWNLQAVGAEALRVRSYTTARGAVSALRRIESRLLARPALLSHERAAPGG